MPLKSIHSLIKLSIIVLVTFFSLKDGLTQLKINRIETADIYSDRIVVKFKSQSFSILKTVNGKTTVNGILSFDPFIKKTPLLKSKNFELLKMFYAQLDQNTSPEKVLSMLRRNPDVEYAEPVYKHRINAEPNDPLLA